MRFFSVAAACLLSVMSVGQVAQDATYRVVLTPAAREFCKKLGIAEPSGRLILRSDSTFEVDGTHALVGRYVIEKQSIAFASESSLDLGSFSPERVVLNGLTYERVQPFVPGVFTLRRKGAEDKSVSFTFDKGGRFAFVGMGCSSKGEWSVRDETLVLTYREIDGQPVESGFTVRKMISLGVGGFKVDEYEFLPAGA